MSLAQTVAVTALEVDQKLSWGIGALSLAILLGLLVGLIAFGGGREHS
jgi:hypothetical protein